MKKVFCLLAMTVSCLLSTYAQPTGSLGIGIGIPYGVFGVNSEVEAISNLNLSLGFGSTLLAGIGYSAGLKYYLINSEKQLRPRISSHYGTNGLIQRESFGFNTYEKFSGLNAGAGFLWRFKKAGKTGLDFDVMGLISSGVFQRAEELGIEEPGRIRFSVGYRFGF